MEEFEMSEDEATSMAMWMMDNDFAPGDIVAMLYHPNMYMDDIQAFREETGRR